MINTLYLPELREMLAENDTTGLAEFCTALHPARTAEFMEGLTPEESWRVLQYTDLNTQVEIFSYLDHAHQSEIITLQDRDHVAALIAELAPDDRVDVLSGVQDEVVEDLLRRMPADDRRDILRLSSYPEGTAGAIMTTGVAKLAETLTVKQAIEEVSRQAEELETIYYLYVVDEHDHLRGLISARQLVSSLGKPETRLRELMTSDLVRGNVLEDQELVAQKVARFDLLALPVVDEQNRLVGIVTHDDVVDVLREEATGGRAPHGRYHADRRQLSGYAIRHRVRSGGMAFRIVRRRAVHFYRPAQFEDAIAAIVALSLFVPLVISTGGNSGSQAATLVTRAMALGQIGIKDWLRLLKHELLMGIALGLTLGGIGFVRPPSRPKAFWGGRGPLDARHCDRPIRGGHLPVGHHHRFHAAAVVQTLRLRSRLRLEPLVATFVDVTGIVIYFSIAHLYLL